MEQVLKQTQNISFKINDKKGGRRKEGRARVGQPRKEFAHAQVVSQIHL